MVYKIIRYLKTATESLHLDSYMGRGGMGVQQESLCIHCMVLWTKELDPQVFELC